MGMIKGALVALVALDGGAVGVLHMEGDANPAVYDGGETPGGGP